MERLVLNFFHSFSALKPKNMPDQINYGTTAYEKLDNDTAHRTTVPLAMVPGVWLILASAINLICAIYTVIAHSKLENLHLGIADMYVAVVLYFFVGVLAVACAAPRKSQCLAIGLLTLAPLAVFTSVVQVSHFIEGVMGSHMTSPAAKT